MDQRVRKFGGGDGAKADDRPYGGSGRCQEALGFTSDRKIGKHRWVVTAVVESTK